MGEMALGYGSEFQLLRMLGRHREHFSRAALRAMQIANEDVRWLDFPFSPISSHYDHEEVGLHFLSKIGKDYEAAKTKYDRYWPRTGSQQNWDLVGVIGKSKIVLVEAKAHIAEMSSSTGAGEKSLEQIKKTFSLVQSRIGIKGNYDWTKDYYQFANRLFTVWFLKEEIGIETALMNVYFTNDLGNTQRVCPKTKAEWQIELVKMKKILGIEDNEYVKQNVFDCFVDVLGNDE